MKSLQITTQPYIYNSRFGVLGEINVKDAVLKTTTLKQRLFDVNEETISKKVSDENSPGSKKSYL